LNPLAAELNSWFSLQNPRFRRKERKKWEGEKGNIERKREKIQQGFARMAIIG
jgi:hypothetical protein